MEEEEEEEEEEEVQQVHGDRPGADNPFLATTTSRPSGSVTVKLKPSNASCNMAI